MKSRELFVLLCSVLLPGFSCSVCMCVVSQVCPMNTSAQVDPQKSGHEVWEEFSHSFTPAVREVVEFAKKIPGFRDLSQSDQVSLLKAGTFEVGCVVLPRLQVALTDSSSRLTERCSLLPQVLVVRFASLFDTKERTVTFLGGKKYSVDTLRSMGAGDLLNSMFDFSEKLMNLGLSEEEMSLFTAVVLVSAGGFVLPAKAAVHHPESYCSVTRCPLPQTARASRT